ncbi:MAG: hypothetical protein U1A77_17155 [Pirellulales bacterium]
MKSQSVNLAAPRVGQLVVKSRRRWSIPGKTAYGAVAILTWLWAIPAANVASAPPSRNDVDRLLELAWDAAPDKRAEAENYFAQLAESTNRDSHVLYAQALAKIKQRRYADALKLIDELVELEPKNVEYARGRVWLLVLLRKPEQGLVALGKLAGQLPAASEPAGDGEDSHLDLLRFAGRVHGFLEGPGADWMAESARENYRRKLVDSLPESRKTAFLEGRDEVVDRWLGQKDDQQSTRDKVKRDQEQQRDERLSDLDKQREQDERRAADLNSERTRLRSELNDQMADFQRQERPLIDQISRLDAQATVVRRDITVVSSDIARLEGLLLRERDPILRDQYRRDISRLDAIASRQQATLAGLVRQGNSLAAQRADIQRRAAQVQQSMGRQLDGVDKEQSDAQKRTKAADNEERRLRKAPLGDSTQLRAMSAQSTAFTTYVAFPLEEERERLLESLQKR